MATPPFRISAKDPNFNQRVIDQLNNIYTKLNRSDRVVSIIEERIRPTGGSGGTVITTVPNHDHSGGTVLGTGGQLDWDVVWDDAVHSHGSNAEGGQLTFSTTFTNAVHDHTDNAGGGQLVHDSVFASLDSDSHHEHATVGGAPLTISTQAVTFNYETDHFDVDGNNLTTKQYAHLADASTSHAISDPGDAPATADALRDDLVANAIPDVETALDALGTKINTIISTLESVGIMATD